MHTGAGPEASTCENSILSPRCANCKRHLASPLLCLVLARSPGGCAATEGVAMPRSRRNKVFGTGRAVPLDRNAKARVWAYAQGWTALHRRKGQHRGPLTRAYLDVLRALLWGFHNAHTGRCFPSYERIAEAAKVDRATVAKAIKALEAGRVLSWENRLVRQRVIVPGLLGPVALLVPRRTSNAYWFRDPTPKSPNFPGTRLKSLSPLGDSPPAVILDPSNQLDAALARLSRAMDSPAREEADKMPGVR